MSSSSEEQVSQWEQRIKMIQLERATPEVIERIKSQAERTKRAQKSIQQVSRIERINYLSSVTNERTLQDYSSITNSLPMAGFAAAPAQMQARKEMTSASTTHQLRSKKLMSILKSAPKQEALLPPPPALDFASMERLPSFPVAVVIDHNSAAKCDFDDDEEVELLALERELGAATVTDGLFGAPGGSENAMDLNVIQQSVATGIDELLRQLIHEPSNDDELAAKFLLFENFLETVTTIRDTTLSFWAENIDQFEGSSRDVQQKLIDDIDAADKLGIPDDASKWFVYHMTRQANNNSKAISAVLSIIKGKLNILSQELGECPFCLDQLQHDHLITLRCCHRTCKPCWEHWSELKGSRAFCPLCNHNEFVNEIVSA